MPFSEFMTDSVKLIKANGDVLTGIKALVDKNNIFIDRDDFIVNAGDLVQRIMSNGGEETYKVINPHFREKCLDMPAGYELEVKKIGIQEAEKEIATITNINIYGNYAKVNQNSVDNSTNTFFVDSVHNAIDELRLELRKLHKSPEILTEQMEIIDAVESELLSEKPRKSIVSSLLSALPKIENITNIANFIGSLVN